MGYLFMIVMIIVDVILFTKDSATIDIWFALILTVLCAIEGALEVYFFGKRKDNDDEMGSLR